MGTEQQAGALVTRHADQQLRVIRVDDIGGEYAVVGGFLAQLVRFTGELPHQGIEPEQSRRDTREQQLDPVHPRHVRQLVGDDRLGFTGRLNCAAVEQDHRAHQPPADRRGELIAREQRGAMLVNRHFRTFRSAPHIRLSLDELRLYVGTGPQRNEPHECEEGDAEQNRRRNSVYRRGRSGWTERGGKGSGLGRDWLGERSRWQHGLLDR